MTIFQCIFLIDAIFAAIYCCLATQLIHDSHQLTNSLAPGRSEFNFRQVIFSLIFCDWWLMRLLQNALRWTSLDLTDVKSTLVQVMAWCRQATSHYLSQCCHMLSLSYKELNPKWISKSVYIFLVFCQLMMPVVLSLSEVPGRVVFRFQISRGKSPSICQKRGPSITNAIRLGGGGGGGSAPTRVPTDKSWKGGGGVVCPWPLSKLWGESC